ncbi:transporter substrate-binding domain-containing protein [Methanoregula sp. PtaB.Bin085]|uniref:transporter substrate-binding domain-containing protein n=1 Tax=Methanoregula sp. PtaB.Bin085 TaxID=1811680 RepID=UPI0009C94BE2|nr:transporter substrate-binding domain-containing protein [Methanoregula sp. PtaB.Bin085]OPX64564.1 MAG: cystine transporter subunit [Methanoregula sp. PtaB.Bin085]
MKGSHFTTVLIIAAFVLIAIAAGTGPVQARTISVVMDNNYPPYIFPDSTGQPQGILIDQWRLWEEKTGNRANITATDWNTAQVRMDAGEFDVIDTIFRSGTREQKYDFSKPYATLDVPLYVDADISGISGPESLEGFVVAVKSGDYTVEYLRSRGVTSFHEYPSYEAIVSAAKNGDVVVFCIDKPPAVFFLHKYGIQNHFRETAPLYSGQFHRAVKKGDTQTLAEVQAGFDAISPAEYENIDRKWTGSSVISTEFLWSFAVMIAGILALFAIVVLWNRTLQKKVEKSTARLREEARVSADRAEALRESEERYRNLFEHNPAPMLIYGRSTLRLLAVNEAFRTCYGYTQEEALAMVLTDLYPEEEKEPIADLAKRLHGYARAGEWHHRKKDGSWMTIVAYSHDILFKGVEARVAVITDITELKKTAEALQLAHKKLNQLNTITFQDIQSAAFALNSYLELMKREIREPTSIPFIDRQKAIVRQLTETLDFSKKYQTMGMKPPSWQNVEQVFLFAISHLPALSVERDLAVSGLEIYADPLLETAFANLVSAMIHYGTGATRFSFRSRENPDGSISLVLEDNGRGIPTEERTVLFTPESGQGTGAGLVLAREILSITGITLREEGAEGQGTRFVIGIPRSECRFTGSGNSEMRTS